MYSPVLNGRNWSNVLFTLTHFNDTLALCYWFVVAFIWNKLQNVLILSLSSSNSFSTFPSLFFSEGMTLHAFLIKTDNLMAEWALISTLLTFKLDLQCQMELFGIQYKTLFLFFPPFLDYQLLRNYCQSLKMISQWLLVSTMQFLCQSWSLFIPLLGSSESPCVCSMHTAETLQIRRSLYSSL